VHGSRVEPKDALFRIADLSRVWVLADVYEYELPRVAIGQSAEVTLPYWPGKSFAGRINYVYPEVDPKTRTVKVRLEVENPGTELKVDMLANVEIKVAPRVSLVVPEDAVIETGERKLVFLIEGDSRLVPREIRTSGRAEHLYEVQSGLAEGQKVAAGASFLLDSESRLRALQKPPSALENAAPKPEDHSGHGGHGGPGGHSGHGGG
jgi:Cu(I)/Ag(I) efflux system membrane fusion protein